MIRLSLITLLILIQIKVYGQQYNLKDFNLEGDINTWYSARFDSVNIKPMTGVLASLASQRPKVNAFFTENTLDWMKASIMYDNQRYDNVRIKYDIEQQLAYISHPLNKQTITLDQQLVNWFRTPAGIFKPKNEATGYYLIIFEGEQLSLVKESSKRLVIQNREFDYARTDELFLLTNNEKVRIKNRKSYLKQFPTHKKEIKKFMRSQESREINRMGKESFLIHLAKYCDNLSIQ
ncbi:hypothetical protein AWW67_01805 [Roseivirga seohaensis]|uniref:Uncharacterized protein n=1 Tax=Roseivirga seohaensis TaxID=1914963 RepID=A0A150Y1K4_9BACT|nr:hypothetical protein [Roseivirga seohaensis]KYG84806.1 hypothetical protein AWW67_01805 [Roseivirga seohaensis]|tara:strand:+ start:1387 stop:2091 length:705 start_codon:yes stop_codon:yes gene_type:complete